jgi:putative membrane protein insertion efficiency factor
MTGPSAFGRRLLGALRGLPALALVAAIHGYRLAISPLLGPACRFDPSCSAYASEAIARHGVRAGVPLALRRLLRCLPFRAGGYDPVPHEVPRGT